eukprot:48451_1
MSPSDESSSSSPAERQWDVAGLFKDNHEKINGLDFDKSGEFLVTSGDDHAVNLYDVNTARLRKVVYSRRYGVQAVRFTHHVPAVICASRHPTNHAVRYMSMHDNSYIRFFEGHTAQVTGLVMSPVNDTFMSASLDQTVRMWDLRIKGCQAFLRSNGRTVVAVDPEGLISAVGCGNGEVKLYDPRHYEQGPFTTFVHKQKQQIDWTSIQINNDGKMIVLTANNNQVVVMDSFKGTVMHTFSAPDPRTLLFDAVFSPSNKEVLAGSSSGNVMSWSLVGGSFRTFPADSSAVEHVAFNPAKEMFASGGSHLAFWLKRRPGDIVKNTAGASETSQKSILLNANLVSNIRPSEFTENASFMNMLPPPPGVAGRTHQQGMAPPNGTPGPATGPPGPQPTGPPSHAGQPVQQHNFQQNGFVPQTGPMQNQQQYMVGQGPQQPGQGRPQGPQQPGQGRPQGPQQHGQGRPQGPQQHGQGRPQGPQHGPVPLQGQGRPQGQSFGQIPLHGPQLSQGPPQGQPLGQGPQHGQAPTQGPQHVQGLPQGPQHGQGPPQGPQHVQGPQQGYGPSRGPQGYGPPQGFGPQPGRRPPPGHGPPHDEQQFFRPDQR